eukprot:2864997-Prymnesium_polylepis.1
MGATMSVTCLASGALIDRGVPPNLLYAAASMLHVATALAATQLGHSSGGATACSIPRPKTPHARATLS